MKNNLQEAKECVNCIVLCLHVHTCSHSTNLLAAKSEKYFYISFEIMKFGGFQFYQHQKKKQKQK